MVSQYTTKQKTNRWFLAFFYNMLDISALAAYIYTNNNPSKRLLKHGRRRIFLQELGEHLCMPNILKRAQTPRVLSYFPTRSATECLLGRSINQVDISTTNEFVEDEDDRGHSEVKGSCYICYHEVDKRKRCTRKACLQCKKPVCAEHSKVQTKCKNCI